MSVEVDGMTMRFKAGDVVEAHDRNNTGLWRVARIEREAPYRGREGYYVLWVMPLGAPSWESRGGWMQGSSVRPADDDRGDPVDACDVRDCGVEREPGMRVCRGHARGMAAAFDSAR